MNYYEVLEINVDASEDDIKVSFRRLAKKYHPDAKTGSETKFKLISEAYTILSNPNERRRYDSRLLYDNRKSSPSSRTHTRQYRASNFTFNVDDMHESLDNMNDIINIFFRAVNDTANRHQRKNNTIHEAWANKFAQYMKYERKKNEEEKQKETEAARQKTRILIQKSKMTRVAKTLFEGYISNLEMSEISKAVEDLKDLARQASTTKNYELRIFLLKLALAIESCIDDT